MKRSVTLLCLLPCLGSSAGADTGPTVRTDQTNASTTTTQLQVIAGSDTNNFIPLNTSLADGGSFIVGGTLAGQGNYRK
jgi:hypothetical protein